MSSTVTSSLPERVQQRISRGALIIDLIRPSVRGALTRDEIEDLYFRLHRTIAFTPSGNERRMIVLTANSDELIVIEVGTSGITVAYSISLRLSLRDLNLELAVLSGMLNGSVQADAPALERTLSASH